MEIEEKKQKIMKKLKVNDKINADDKVQQKTALMDQKIPYQLKF